MIAQPRSLPAGPAAAPAGGATEAPGQPDAVAAERALVELLALPCELHEQDYPRRADGLDRAGADRLLGQLDADIAPDGLLRRRELDVLRLLAEGRSNRAIAQAVTRYLRLLGMPGP